MAYRRNVWACAAMLAGLVLWTPAPVYADAFETLGAYLQARDEGRGADAARLAARLDADALAELGLEAREARLFRLELAEVRAEAGDLSGAIDGAGMVLEHIRRAEGEGAYAQVEVLVLLARWEAAQGDRAAALAHLDAAIAIAERVLGVESPALLPLLQERAAIAPAPPASPRSEMGLSARSGSTSDRMERIERARDARREGDEAPAARALDGETGFQLVRVFYGANRAPTGRETPTAYYGGARGPLQTGIVTVSVPDERELGSIPKPSVWRLEFRPDPQKHVIVEDLETFPNLAVFVDELRTTLRRSQKREAFIYIHGFNNDFDAAAERTAQLAVDLELDGAPILYSWPSRGRVFGYVADGASLVRPVVDDLAQFLTVIARNSGARRVHIAAHSMGNRYLMAALEELEREHREGAAPLFDEMVFAAPDIDAADFAARLPDVQRLAARMTLYASAKDRALLLSKRINGGYLRAGDAASPVMLRGLETVDTTRAPRSSLRSGQGHNDVFDDALDDFRSVIWFSLEPQQRCILEPRQNRNRRVLWAYEVPDRERCDADVYAAAILSMRRLGCVATEQLLNNQVELTTAAGDQASAKRWRDVRDIVRVACGA